MKTLIIILSLITFSVSAETRLIIPFATTHIGGGNFNNSNYGIGVEYKSENYLYTAMYLKENSYSEPSVFLALSKEISKNDITFSGGIAVASGYKAIHDTGYIATSLVGVAYKNFRIVTSYPFSELFCEDENNVTFNKKDFTLIAECGDFVNLQYIHKF